ncbi:MAG: glycine cleavage system aminomethyltransferase GcvT [Candidatus Marinimicrobia bacterium]|nr:glycine cleavage system aminomethyltransferase GcvT [Candidatus Neomarinimicrobiota bacterium]
MTASKKTALYERHINLGAKMVSFAGYQMPVSYPVGIQKEYSAVRNDVGMFDVSHMGQFSIIGDGTLDFLQKVTINDVSKMKVNEAQYSAMCYPNGGIVDDLILYRKSNGYFAVINASNIEKDFDWLKQNLTGDVELENLSDEYSLIAIQGPKTRELLSQFTDADLHIPFYSYIDAEVCGNKIMLSRTGYTGELGFEIYGNHIAVQEIWDSLIDTGEVTPAGLASRDVLRMEMKYCLYGNDIDKTTNPIEASLGWVTALDKGDFIGRDVIAKVRENRPNRRLITFVMEERGIPRQGYEIQVNSENVGIVTSGTQSPILNCGIGLGYVKRGLNKSGNEIDIIIRNKPVKAKIVKPPFVKNTSLME